MADQTLSRRRLFGAGAAAGAGAVLVRVPGAAAEGSRSADVAIVGAGLAGLTAARKLTAAGRSVVVVEARNRVGGRVHNHELPGGDVSERGGTFVGPTQGHIRRLVAEMGVEEFPTYNRGDNVYVGEPLRLTYSDRSPAGIVPPDPTIDADIINTVVQLDEMSKEVPVDAPWEAAKAAEWDGQTLESWLRDNTTYAVNERFRGIVSVTSRPIFGAEPGEISLLFALFYIAASGDERNVGTFERNFSTRNGAQMFRLEGGPSLVAARMARDLGDAVVLDSPVRRIEQEAAGVRVLSDRVNVSAKHVVVAVPPTLAGRIEYRPGLPWQRDQLTQRLPQGTLMKVACRYDRPFWRGKGLTGSMIDIDGPIAFTADDSPRDGRPGVVFGFVGGDAARAFAPRPPAERRAAIIAQLERAFGPEARAAREYFETNWGTEEWTRGCPVAIAGPGTLTAFGPWIRRPIGRIHWAGTETSTYWTGYMDGAVRSGERAAREVLDRL